MQQHNIQCLKNSIPNKRASSMLDAPFTLRKASSLHLLCILLKNMVR